MQKLQPKTFAPYYFTSPFTSALFRDEQNKLYCYGPRYESSEVTGPTRLSGLCVEDVNDHWYVFLVQDCAFPPMYAVSAASWNEAYEQFIDECEHLVAIAEEDRSAYNCGETNDESKKRCDFNCRGTPCATELVTGFAVQLIEARV